MLIGLTGPAGVGKTTLANELVKDYGWSRIGFGNGIKAATRGLLDYLSNSRSQPDLMERIVVGELKDTRLDLLYNLTSRDIQIAIGEGIRKIDPYFWVKSAMREAETQLRYGQCVVFDDIRKNVEAHAIRDAGGIIIKLSRYGWKYNGVGGNTPDISEEIIEDFEFTSGKPRDQYLNGDANELIAMVMKHREEHYG